jgi:hypothetical protein
MIFWLFTYVFVPAIFGWYCAGTKLTQNQFFILLAIMLLFGFCTSTLGILNERNIR